MRINGNLVFNSNATGELQNVYIERLNSAPAFDPAHRGRIYFNTTNSLYYFNDGTAWQPFATGGNATITQQYLNNLIASVGPAVNSDGTWNGGNAFASTPIIAGATSVTNALILLANIAASSDTLAELDDVQLAALATGQYLRYDANAAGPGVGRWVNDTIDTTDINGVTASASELNILDGATLDTTELNFVDGVTSPIQTQLNGKQPLDATLTGLAQLNGTGIVVGNATDGFTYRSLVAPAAGIAITNPDGVVGNPTFALANDLAALEGLSTLGYVVRTADGAATTRAIAGTVGRIEVLNSNGVASDTSIDLATVTQAATGDFRKITLDTFGRVTGNTPVVSGDITALVDAIYVNAAGDTMSGNLNMNSFTVTGLGAPTVATDAATKGYVDSIAGGLTWQAPVANVQSGTLSGTGLASGDRVLNLTDNRIYTWSGSAFDAGVVPADGWALFDKSTETGYVFSGISWVQFTGTGQITAGLGLIKTGNVLDVNLGAGISELPTDEVGIDLYDGAAGAIVLTTTGTDRSTATGAKLHLLLDAAGALAQGVNGLRVNAASVTNAMLVNSGFTINGDTGTDTLSLGDTFQVRGTAVQGISVNVTEAPAGTSTFTITAANASTTQKGVASFATADFDVTAGAVSIKAAGVGNAQLENSSITFAGNTGTQVVDLGQTVSIRGQGTHVGGSQAINVVASATNNIDITARLASATDVGVARFASADFTVTAGEVTAVAKGLDSLTDVAVSGASAGQTLVHNGTQFVNRPIYFLYSGAAATSHTVTHNLGQKYCNVTVVETATDEVVIPQSITYNSNNGLTVTFTSAIACTVIVMGVNSAA